MQRIDALEQRVVLQDALVVGGELRPDLALDREQRVVGVGAGEVEEHGRDAFEQPAARAPARSMVLPKLGASACAVTAAISASCSAKARSNAGMKCSGAMRPNGGTSNAAVQVSKKGLGSEGVGWFCSVMATIWCPAAADATPVASLIS